MLHILTDDVHDTPSENKNLNFSFSHFLKI